MRFRGVLSIECACLYMGLIFFNNFANLLLTLEGGELMDSENLADFLWMLLFCSYPWFWLVADQGWMGPDAKKRADVFSSYIGREVLITIISLATIALVLWRVYR